MMFPIGGILVDPTKSIDERTAEPVPSIVRSGTRERPRPVLIEKGLPRIDVIRLSRALRQHVEIISAVSDISSSASVISGRLSGFIIGVDDRDFPRQQAELQRLAARFPQTICIAYFAGAVLTVFSGATQEILTDTWSATDIGCSNSLVRSKFEHLQRRAAQRQVLDLVGSVISLPLIRLACYALEAPSLPSVSAAAIALSVDRRTLLGWCVRNGGPPPSEFIRWMRLMLAAQLYRTTHRTIDAIAWDLGFPSTSAFRNTFKRYTGASATALADGGAVNIFASFVSRQRNRDQPQ
jgi:AraC-like DNA-binding protein